jgi:hypothetical protein
LIVRAFYLLLTFILIDRYFSWNEWLQLKALNLLWPVLWFNLTGVRAGVMIVIAVSLIGALAAFARPDVRWCRILAAMGILLFGAFFNSFGVINHGLHGWIWVAAIFCILPDGGAEELGRCTSRAQRYLFVLWSAQAALLLFYSLSGAFKIAGAVLQISRGEISAFSPEALPRHIATKMLEVGSSGPGSVFGAFIIDHPLLTWPLYILFLYIEFFSVLVAFRPTLHRAWGVMLVLVHVVTYLILSIMFSWHLLLVGLMFVCSPFAQQSRLSDVIRALPVIGDFIAWTATLRRYPRGAPRPARLGTAPQAN